MLFILSCSTALVAFLSGSQLIHVPSPASLLSAHADHVPCHPHVIDLLSDTIDISSDTAPSVAHQRSPAGQSPTPLSNVRTPSTIPKAGDRGGPRGRFRPSSRRRAVVVAVPPPSPPHPQPLPPQ